jgi:arsenite/tail-anchored protein-transporting ATPase
MPPPPAKPSALLTMPDTFSWYVGHLSRAERGMIKALKPFAGRFLQAPAQVLEAVYQLEEGHGELRKTLSDPEISSYRVVLHAGKNGDARGGTAVSYLGLFDYPIDQVVVNRVMPADPTQGEFYQTKYATQQKYLAMIYEQLPPVAHSGNPLLCG